jgi:hypothetical protein
MTVSEAEGNERDRVPITRRFACSEMGVEESGDILDTILTGSAVPPIVTLLN